MKAKKTDFSKGSVYRNILEVAVPMTAAQIISLLYNIVDRMYIGRIPGEGRVALTGLGICFPIIMMINAFANLFGTGGAPICAMEQGKGDYEEAEKVMGNTCTLLVAAGIILMILGMIFNRPLLYAFGASDTTYSYARDYGLIYLAGTVFVMISLGMNGFINNQGFARTGMMTVLVGAVMNIVLDPVFIFVFDMGVRGAAIATVASQMVSAFWVLRFLTGKNTVLHLYPGVMKLKLKRVKQITLLGLTGFMMQFTNSVVQIVCNSTLQTYGGDLYVGVMTVMSSIREIFNMPAMGLTNGAQPVISYNYGAGQYDRVKKAIKFMSVTGVILFALLWGIVALFPEFFVHIFNSDPEMIRTCVPVMHIYFFGLFMMSLQFSGQSVFVALGKARYAIFFSIFRKIVIVVPLTILLPGLWNLGTNGVFAAEPVSNFVGGAACFITMLCVVMPELNGKK
ncbi:MAG: MATE family efflux transporter [Ruminococcus sp.]